VGTGKIHIIEVKCAIVVGASEGNPDDLRPGRRACARGETQGLTSSSHEALPNSLTVWIPDPVLCYASARKWRVGCEQID
jgi:hypothetical protein